MDYDEEKYRIIRELEIKRTIIIVFSILLIIAIITIFSLYIAKAEFRKWVDVNILRKEINQKNIATIDLNTEKNNQIYCYSNHVCILKDKNLTLYTPDGIKDTELLIDINTAIFDSNNKYLAVAEKAGQEFCVVLDKVLLWKEKTDGEILQIHINKNGYVALITTDTTYKSIITLYNPEGKQLLKNYLATTRVVDADISNDNNYIAFAELDSSGAMISSNIKVLSIEKAKENPNEATVYKYNLPSSKMITKIKYQDNNKLVYMSDEEIEVIKEEERKNIVTINNGITFESINLNNYIAYIGEETSGLLNYNSILNIINTSNNQINTYDFNEVAKEMYTYDNIIGVNMGTEIYFINTSGMLLKKYNSTQEISSVILSNNLALIIYKDRVEIIKI